MAIRFAAKDFTHPTLPRRFCAECSAHRRHIRPDGTCAICGLPRPADAAAEHLLPSEHLAAHYRE